ncbi:mammalian cell entry protein [Mycolicibacterium sp. 018/SC-01/001]|uniref:mammalian cell entry protein n=1 Tax=Mycolicibacterium sp. 018/SC-01/001 TaxID=2592069 RepID=UPI00117D940F|nr:mammalian cell entry protein [Mycolicibacterium sp. 018/SC-01/001]TRW87814.1 mammalian cell entry protein [Mycolicibacterium sp. 018/SC-01/001]
MEDQQPDSGDLTTEDPASSSDPAGPPRRRRFFRRSRPAAPAAEDAEDTVERLEPESTAVEQPLDQPRRPVGKAARSPKQDTEPEDAAPEGAASEDAASEADTAADEPAVEIRMVEHRPAGRGLVAAAVVASVLFVGGGAFAGAMVQPYLAQRALNTTKLEIARTATAAITALWTYTPDDMPALADRASRFLGGDFAADYRKYIDAIIEPNKQAQVTNTTEVVGAAVESVSPALTPTDATAIVYTNSISTSPVTKNIPSLRYLSYRLTMKRDGGEWLITRMSTVTSFDLTPQL